MFEIENINAFDDLLTFDLKLMSLCLVFLAFFFFIWAREIKKTGWKFDFWHGFVGFRVVFPVILMYPFSQSIYNYDATDEFLPDLEQFIPLAFLSSFLGCIFLYAGRWYFDYKMKNNYELKINFFENRILKNLEDKYILSLLTIGYFGLFLIIFSILQANNALFAGRDFFQSQSQLRPLFNLTLTISSYTIIFTCIHYFNTRNKKYLFLSLSIIFTCIIYGTRAVLLEPLILLFILWASCYYNRFKFRYILIICLSAFFLFFFILLLREGRLDTVDKQVVYGDVLYGNTFSDLRDFAIFLSNWDFNFLFGKTYLAGIISFIPRFISEFREEWAIGVVTTYFVGFDSNEHPGLRINPFGEMFINFGFPGVIILSFVLGYYLRKIDYGIKSNMTSAAPSFNKNYALLSHSYLLLCLINSSTFPLYYTFVILMFLFALVQFGVKKLGLSDKSDP